MLNCESASLPELRTNFGFTRLKISASCYDSHLLILSWP